MERSRLSIFKPYDIRGIYPEEINEKKVYNIARAFVDFMRCKKAVVGRDMRTSSPELFNALIKGITDQGADVIDIGLCSTPMFYYAVKTLGLPAGVMITASHNPKQYNGLKLVGKNAEPLNGENGIKEIERIVDEKDYNDTDSRGLICSHDMLKEYLEYVKTYAGKISGLKIVIDCGNGMAGKTIIPLLKDFDIKLVSMYDEIDGTFPNHDANPFEEKNTADLQKKVVQEKADAGFAFDGDVDRVLIVDEKGERISGDITTALIAKEILSKIKGKIMYDLRSSKAVPEMILKEGGTPLVSRVGHSFIKERMKKEDVIFAGEISGHYYFKDNFFTDSAAIPLMMILSLLSRNKTKLSHLVSSIMKYHHSGEISRKVNDTKKVIENIKKKYSDAKITHLDGVTIEYENWWFNLRESNTEPVIRLNLEADNKRLMEEKTKEVLNLII